MDTVTVKKDELAALVQKNREGHQAVFEEAVEGYRKQVTEQLEAYLARVKQGDLMQVAINLPVPVNHITDYDRVLKMLEMSVHDEIEISQDDFASYAMDDWSWKRQFLTTSSSYSALARRALN